MARLLHISASPRGHASESIAIAEQVIRGYRHAHPGAEVQTWNLWDGTLPGFGPAATGAKMAVFAGSAPSGDEARAWAQVQVLVGWHPCNCPGPGTGHRTYRCVSATR